MSDIEDRKMSNKNSYMGVVIPYSNTLERYIKALNLYLYMVKGEILPPRESQVMAMYLQYGVSDSTKRTIQESLLINKGPTEKRKMTKRFLNKITFTLVNKGLLERKEDDEGVSYLTLSEGLQGFREHIKGGDSTPNFVVKFQLRYGK